jgi:predicted HTH domain antitoxin
LNGSVPNADRQRVLIDGRQSSAYVAMMSVTLDFDEQVLASLPLGPGERERHMQIELACRFYANGWLTSAQGAQITGLDQFAVGVSLAERGIPRHYGTTQALKDVAHARRQ